jgi:hypothetical protein
MGGRTKSEVVMSSMLELVSTYSISVAVDVHTKVFGRDRGPLGQTKMPTTERQRARRKGMKKGSKGSIQLVRRINWFRI